MTADGEAQLRLAWHMAGASAARAGARRRSGLEEIPRDHDRLDPRRPHVDLEELRILVMRMAWSAPNAFA